MYDLWIMCTDGTYWYTRSESDIRQDTVDIDGSVFVTFYNEDDFIVAQVFGIAYQGAVKREVGRDDPITFPVGKAIRESRT